MSQGSSPMTGVEDRAAGGATPQSWGSHLRHLLVGFLMGCAEVVPGVSGGTVALIGGVYTRLIDAVRDGVDVALTIIRGRPGEGVRRLRALDWVFLIPMGVGMVVAVLSLARVISHFLEDEPVKVSGLFAGLVLGSVVVAFALIRKVEGSTLAIVVGVGTVMFLLLGLRQETEAAEIDAASAPLWAYPLAASVAICAWILPGVSGSLMLVMMGMYAHVFAALDNRDMLPIVLFALGAVVGLAVFSKILAWLLDRYHDQVVAVMIGLMFGSLRVLWPWPGGVESTKLEGPGDDMVIPILLAVLGFVVVAGLGRMGVVNEEPVPDGEAEADGARAAAAAPRS